MSSVLIRDVPSDDLEQLRAAAGRQGSSLQSYLLETVHAQAAYLRRQDALAAAHQRLQGGRDVPETERAAVLDAIDADHGERAAQLGARPAHRPGP